MRTPKTISWRFWLSLVPVALFLAGIALLAQELKPNAPPESPELLRAKLDSISKDADNVKWLLSTVVLFAGVLTTAQGVLAFFAVQNYVKQADDAMKRVTDAVAKTEKLADEVKSKYPMFADIEAARSAAFDELSHIVPDLDTDQNLYAQATPHIRQRIFSIESFVAVQFLAPTNRSDELLRNLRLLAKFYAGKFAAERGASDFDRADYYLQLATEKFDSHFSVLNDRGWLYSTIAVPVNNARAQAYFEQSYERVPHQQRALYNMGTMIFDTSSREKTEEARKYLVCAARQTNWEHKPNRVLATHIHYNLACVYNAKADFASDAAARAVELGMAMRALEDASEFGAQEKKILSADLWNGDLCHLRRSPTLRERLRNTIKAYRTAWTRTTTAALLSL